MTNKQPTKHEIIEILKFTPIKARLLVQGYGGESYIGSVDRKDYEVFKSKNVNIEQYLGDWDNELFKDIPNENRFVEPGNAYECDNLFHASGATMDDASYVTVTNDDTMEDIFYTTLDIAHLEDQGIEVECGDGFDSDELDDGSVIFWGGQGEKGCFFDAELTLTKPFDPKLLRLTYSNGDGWNILTGVEYDGVELEGYDGYSTTGKWGEHKFYIVGDEQVYEGVEREEFPTDQDIDELLNSEDSDQGDGYLQEAADAINEGFAEELATTNKTPVELMYGLSDWFNKDVNPYHKGEYEVVYDAEWPLSGQGMAEWSGRSWKQNGKKLAIKKWRGLASNPYQGK